MDDFAGKLLIAALSAAVTIIVCFFNNYFQKKREDKRREHEREELIAAQNQAMALIEYKIGELTEEVREHNNFARRMPVLEEKIRVINHRIKDLEEGGKQT